MTKARTLGNFVSTGSPFADGTLVVADISDLTASAAELNELGDFAGTFTLPTTDGTSGQVLTTNGSGALTLQSIPASGGSLTATASGSLTAGNPVIVNADGTVSAVSGSAESTFLAANGFGNGRQVSVVYSPDNQKVAIFYTDNGNSNYGTAVVGTVSGSAITFGSPQVFQSSSTRDITAVYDTANDKFVVLYSNVSNSYYGTACVASLSGTTFTFGTPVVFNSGGTYKLASTYDPTNSKVIVVYQASDSDSGGNGQVGTVSGTSISFGSAAILLGGSNTNFPSCIYDPVSTKIIFVFEDVNSGGAAGAVVGTVSGTSLSYSAKTGPGGGSIDGTKLTIDPDAGRIIFGYITSSTFRAIPCFVSGGTVSFGSEVTIGAASNSNFVSLSYDENSNKVLALYSNKLKSSPSGTTLAFGVEQTYAASAGEQNSTYSPVSNSVIVVYERASAGRATSIADGAVSNLTSTNFIGFVGASYTDGQEANVQIVSSVNSNQSGLTAAVPYYVTTSGSLSTTAGSPSVLAGTAVSATKIIVKG